MTRLGNKHQERRLRVSARMAELNHWGESRGHDARLAGAERDFWEDPADGDGEMPRDVALGAAAR